MERGKLWKKAKETFVALVLKEAPNKLGKEQIVGSVVNKNDGAIVQLCSLLDTIEEQFGMTNEQTPPEKLTKIVENFSKNSATLEKCIETMTTSLRVAIEHYKDERAPGTAKMKENLVRGLKVLKTSLDAIDKTNAAWVQKSQDVIKARTQRLNTYETMSNAYMGVLKASVARGLAAAQRIKANPTPQVYNAEFPKAARDIWMQVNNVKILIAKGVPPPGPKDITVLAAGLDPFAQQGPMSSLDLNATPARVLELTSQFNKAVKAVVTAYGIK